MAIFQRIIIAGVLEIFAGFFGNILNVVMILMFLVIGVIIGIFIRPRWKNTVMKIMPKDRRFIDFNIKEETAISVVCDDKKGFPPHRFLKIAIGYIGETGMVVKRAVTRYIAKEGTAYLWQTDQDKFKRVAGGLPTLLKHLWGEQEYDTMPEDLRHKCEDDKVLVTVDISDGLTPEGLQSVSEEDIKREEDREACRTLWEGKKREEKGAWLNLLIVGLAGFGIACFLQIIGILRINQTSAPAPAPTNQTGA